MAIITTSELKLLQGEWPEQRIGLFVFVDTQNLYYSAKDNYGKALSYQKLLELAVCDRRLQQATAYVVDREGSAQGFMTKLRDIGYRIKLIVAMMYLKVIGIWALLLTWSGSGSILT